MSNFEHDVIRSLVAEGQRLLPEATQLLLGHKEYDQAAEELREITFDLVAHYQTLLMSENHGRLGTLLDCIPYTPDPENQASMKLIESLFQTLNPGHIHHNAKKLPSALLSHYLEFGHSK